MLLGHNRNEPVVSIDIGTSTIKVMQLELSGDKPKLKNMGICFTPAGVFSNNIITKPQEVGEAIRNVLDENKITTKRAITAVPGPSAFTKRVTINYTDLRQLEQNISFEAANYIPHSIDAVHLDFQVVKTNGKSTMDVLLVAVKNEIVNSFTTTLQAAALEPIILDVDYFALENMFELNYPEEKRRTVALLNLGARFCSVILIQDGEIIFYGDIAVGGRLYTEALSETLQMKPKEAEQAKLGKLDGNYDLNLINETLERTTDHITSELQRQLGFFWNTAATSKSIEAIYLAGGAAYSKDLKEELSNKTNTECLLIDPFKAVNCSEFTNSPQLQEVGAAMAVSVGLALRRLADKQHLFS